MPLQNLTIQGFSFVPCLMSLFILMSKYDSCKQYTTYPLWSIRPGGTYGYNGNLSPLTFGIYPILSILIPYSNQRWQITPTIQTISQLIRKCSAGSVLVNSRPTTFAPPQTRQKILGQWGLSPLTFDIRILLNPIPIRDG